jgi:hypothetical protein
MLKAGVEIPFFRDCGGPQMSDPGVESLLQVSNSGCKLQIIAGCNREDLAGKTGRVSGFTIAGNVGILISNKIQISIDKIASKTHRFDRGNNED